MVQEELWFTVVVGQFIKSMLVLAQIFHQLLNTAICGETLMTFRTLGLHWKGKITAIFIFILKYRVSQKSTSKGLTINRELTIRF
jgi:hypothetical protein